MHTKYKSNHISSHLWGVYCMPDTILSTSRDLTSFSCHNMVLNANTWKVLCMKLTRSLFLSSSRFQTRKLRLRDVK